MNYLKFYKTLFLFCCLFISGNAFSQLTVIPNQTAAVLAGTLAGPGVVVYSPTLTCLGAANGTFTATGTLLAMSNGIVLTNGHASACAGPEGPLVSFNCGTPGDPAMAPLLPAGTATVDACILEFNVVATGDTISFNYQFGSEEYRNAVCSIYTDVFAFFISGPGIAGAANMALVPGTNIPVEINSVNNGGLGTVGGAAHANCTSLGAGSPFTAYYIDNTGGPNLTYRGYTTKFRAFHAVTPCDTYHLKLSIVDAGNWQYDSGVFLEGGSLTTNTYTFSHPIGATINGVPNTIVKGCSPATLTVLAAHANTSPETIHFLFGGTAVNGIDINTIPDSVILPAGATSGSLNIQAIPTPPGGSKTFTIYLQANCGIADSVTINILDTPTARILTPDTSICPGDAFTIRVTGTPGLAYSWSPATGLSSTTVMQPIASPIIATTYTLTATLPSSGCPAIMRDITVSIGSSAVTILTPDTTICSGGSVPIRVNGSLSLTYNWSPVIGLNNAAIQDPVATPSATITYSLTATSSAGCPATAQITVTVATANASILTPDTSICIGTSVGIRVTGNPALTYIWTPATGLNNPNIMEPTATPSVTTTYIMTATVPGLPCSVSESVTIGLVSIVANAGSDQLVCLTATIQLNATPTGSNYSYAWSGPGGYASNVQNPAINNAQLSYEGIYTVTVTDNTTGCTGEDTSLVTVTNTNATVLTNVTPNQTIPYGSSIQLNADNALYYMWTPNDGTLDNPNINNPVAVPLATTTYIVYGRDKYGCLDSAAVTIHVTYDTIFIPNAFTPNGDGLNDLFRIGNLGYYKVVEMSVFNRWGAMVYHVTDGNNKGWDGTYNGVPQDLGVYNYYIIVSEPDGLSHSFKGDVTLLR